MTHTLLLQPMAAHDQSGFDMTSTSWSASNCWRLQSGGSSEIHARHCDAWVPRGIRTTGLSGWADCRTSRGSEGARMKTLFNSCQFKRLRCWGARKGLQQPQWSVTSADMHLYLQQSGVSTRTSQAWTFSGSSSIRVYFNIPRGFSRRYRDLRVRLLHATSLLEDQHGAESTQVQHANQNLGILTVAVARRPYRGEDPCGDQPMEDATFASRLAISGKDPSDIVKMWWEKKDAIPSAQTWYRQHGKF